jgi:hypothetical protein
MFFINAFLLPLSLVSAPPRLARQISSGSWRGGGGAFFPSFLSGEGGRLEPQ